ncbi:MAG: HyaD/HybD family hydrogenase maturation endopeptidase [Chromatiales bacterium]
MSASAKHDEKRTLVLGIGNTLLSDEGIGVHVLEALRASKTGADGVEYMDGGTLSFTLAEPIESCQQFIVIDAAELKSSPGTVRVFEADEMDRYITSGNKRSVHEVSLADVMSIALLSGNLPQKRALVGIQPDNLDWGEKPTEPVSAAIPAAIAEIESLIERWSHESV